MESLQPRKDVPPGRQGLPLIGETIAFVRNPFRFIEERLSSHGPVFRSSILGRRTAVIAGPDAAGSFIDDSQVMREGSMPPHIQELFGGKSLPLLDGDVHRSRKSLVLQGFTRAALSSYVPVTQDIVERAFQRWAESGEIRWIAELKRLSLEVICSTVIGMQAGDEMERLRRDYATVLAGFTGLPVNLPGTKFHAALKARDRILETLRERVQQRRRERGEDGLTRILEARNADGSTLSDDEAVLELHHIVIAGFIVFAELGAMVQALDKNRDVCEKLLAEVKDLAPEGPLTLERLASMPYLMQVVNEVKRLCPIIPAVFGRTKQPMVIGDAVVPAGWMVMWAVTPSHTSHGVYSDAARFDPDRFSSARAEDKRHEHAFAPQGAGPAHGHRCPGFDFATMFMQIFGVVMLRSFGWRLPQQNCSLDMAKIPPEPVEGLRAWVSRR